MNKRLPLIGMLLFLQGCASVMDAVSKTAQVLADPSVPVGAPQAQPTKISLSLHAMPDVNPNPYQEPAENPVPETSEVVTVKAHNDAIWDTIEPSTAEPFSNVETLLPESLITPLETVHNTNLVAEALPPPLTAEEQIAETLAASGKQTAEPEPDVDPDATPIAFKIIQLKDNSLLLQADYESLFADIEQTLGTTYLGHDDYVLLPSEFSYIAPTEIAEKTRYIGVAAAYNDIDAAEWKALIKIKPEGHEYAVFVELGKHTVHLKKQEQ